MALVRPYDNPRSRSGIALTLATALTISAGVGWGTAQAGPVVAAVALVGAVLIYLAFKSVWAPLGGLVLVACLLPFFVIPISAAGASPTLFELVALPAVGLYVLMLMMDRRDRLVLGPSVAIWALFGAYLVFAFTLGARFGAGTDLVRLFFRFGLAFALFWLVVQLVRTRDRAGRIVNWIVAGSAAASGLALVLYAGGPSLTFRALSSLVPYGYPDSRVVRFIEDNPENPMRAIGTSVDPNAFGGLVMVGFILAVGLLLSTDHRPTFPLLMAAAGLCGLAMLLTFSRGAWVGAVVGTGIIVWFRARVLTPFAVAGGIALLLLGLGATFVDRLEAGLRLQDPATVQRLDEYRNSIAIIREHPWFGIGFGDAPSPEFGVGVSSIYLLIAEQAGLVGLGLFGLFCAVTVWRAWQRFRMTDDGLLLTIGATFVAMLTIGLVDHYYFNIRFAHMVGLFWIIAGLLVALSSDDVLPEKAEGDDRWR